MSPIKWNHFNPLPSLAAIGCRWTESADMSLCKKPCTRVKRLIVNVGLFDLNFANFFDSPSQSYWYVLKCLTCNIFDISKRQQSIVLCLAFSCFVFRVIAGRLSDKNNMPSKIMSQSRYRHLSNTFRLAGLRSTKQAWLTGQPRCHKQQTTSFKGRSQPTPNFDPGMS